jgi:DNA (cytosine-5)-methyltransferase 1
MKPAYYNEFDPHAAQWLRNLMAGGHIPKGYVDERSIAEVQADDLREFGQIHFFAGIGGWPRALRLAGVPDDMPVWTGSCPCQPFSAAGRHQGQADERHLWPEMYRLIRECKPATVFGEQVSSAIGHGWLDGVSDGLEAEGYAVGAVVLPACSVGAPHIRQRLFWVGKLDGMAYSSAGLEERPEQLTRNELQTVERSGATCWMEHAASEQMGIPGQSWFERDAHWSDFDVVHCADGKERRIKSGSQPLVNGVPFRLANGGTRENTSRKEILKGIGNAIVPQVAAMFIKACL